MKATRRTIQFAALLLTLVAVFVVKGNAEAWCPFGGVEALYNYATEGNMICSLGVSNLYILAAVLLAALLVRRAFCGYLCPIGTISEWLQSGARRAGLKPARVPYRLDRTLALLKYAVLGIILWFTWRAAELRFRVADPCYALLSRHGEDITFWAYVVAGAIVVASLLLLLPFCRWFCPLAAVFAPFSRLGLTRVRRHSDSCVDCGACSRACPMNIQVDRVGQVTASRCISCLECVDACPKEDDGAMSWGPLGKQVRRWPGALIPILLLLCIGGAVAATYAFPMPSFIKTRGTAPETTTTIELEVEGVTCRGSATLLWYFLERDDEYALSDYLRLEAWPGPGYARVHVTFDPAHTKTHTVKQAITKTYVDLGTFDWRTPPFKIAGFDALELESP